MNPEYKEISYHQLMKKIEVLNELNTDQKWFYNKLSEADGAFGSAAKDKKVIQARKKYQLVIDNKLSTEEQRKKAQDILHDEIDAINSEPNEETDTPEDGDTSSSTDEAATPSPKLSFFKKLTNVAKDTFIGGMRSTQLGGAIANNSERIKKYEDEQKRAGNTRSGSRGSASDCNSIKMNTAGLGKVKQNQILKSAGCAEIP